MFAYKVSAAGFRPLGSDSSSSICDGSLAVHDAYFEPPARARRGGNLVRVEEEEAEVVVVMDVAVQAAYEDQSAITQSFTQVRTYMLYHTYTIICMYLTEYVCM